MRLNETKDYSIDLWHSADRQYVVTAYVGVDHVGCWVVKSLSEANYIYNRELENLEKMFDKDTGVISF